MNEASLILTLQQAFVSGIEQSMIGFCARWVIYLFLPLMVVARFFWRHSHAVYEALWSAGIALVASVGIATLVGRVRPYLAVDGILAIVPPNVQAGSLPSSHMAVACAIASALAYKDIPLGIAAFVMALLIGFGRVASGMHYPSDVMVGAVVGVAAFCVVRVGHVALRRVRS